MKGKIFIYSADGAIGDLPYVMEIAGLDAHTAHVLAVLSRYLGDSCEMDMYVNGWTDEIKIIDTFNTICINREVVPCIVFCARDGNKGKRLPINMRASMLWRLAIDRRMRFSPNRSCDWLRGTAIVVTGDQEFMTKL